MKSSKSLSAFFLLTLCIVATLSVVVPVHAQKFPERPVRILVPLAAGGSVDTVARSLSQGLSESFGQSVIVDNRPGAGSQVALEILANADPSGHTLVMISATSVVHPLLQVTLRCRA
jgi:tripartite-type tricarboxylate transporter receptor subunit TctC